MIRLRAAAAALLVAGLALGNAPALADGKGGGFRVSSGSHGASATSGGHKGFGSRFSGHHSGHGFFGHGRFNGHKFDSFGHGRVKDFKFRHLGFGHSSFQTGVSAPGDFNARIRHQNRVFDHGFSGHGRFGNGRFDRRDGFVGDEAFFSGAIGWVPGPVFAGETDLGNRDPGYPYDYFNYERFYGQRQSARPTRCRTQWVWDDGEREQVPVRICGR